MSDSSLHPALAKLGKLALAIVLVPLLVVGAGTLVGAGLAPAGPPTVGLVRSMTTQVLDFEPLGDILENYEQDERSVVVDANGDELAVLRSVNRVLVEIEEIPLDVQNAVLATEDANFREHEGVNWPSVARAALGNLQSGEITSGASTITQQLIKLLTGQAEESLQRKLREAVYAIELEQGYTKDEILEIYLNEAFWGNGVYGIGTAAEYYFSKGVGELTIPEAALLAGVIRSPATNDPIDHPEAARARRDIVIGQMEDAGFITAIEADVFTASPVELRVQELPEVEEPFFVSYVRTLLLDVEALGTDAASRERQVLRGGYTIETTLDPAFQEIADAAIRDVLTDVSGPQAALTAVEPGTGRIVAIGFGPKTFGDGPGETEVLPAVPGVGSSFGRQPGSSFKAFEIVAALEADVPPSYTIDTPSPYRPSGQCQFDDWNPGNYSDGGGGTMDMAAATARSSNVYFAHLVDQFTGPEGLADTATRMGIVNTDLFGGPGPVCSAVLGSREVYPLDMANGFATMAAGGQHCEPYAISRILDRDGTVIYEGGNDCNQAISPEHAATATSLLRGPIENGTASRNGRIGRPAAGKTGTTDDYRDAWFVGFIPQLSTAVWVGNEIPETMVDPRCGQVTGGCLPTMIWQRFMSAAIDYQGYPVVEFPPAPRIRGTTVPSVVGMLEGAAQAVLEDAGFTALTQTVVDFRPAGTVIGQSPAGGSEAPPGSQVLLSVSDGTGEQPIVPSVVGLSEAEAVAALQAAGIVARVVTVPVDDPALYGFVVGQSPGAGEVVLSVPGTTPDSLGVGEVVIEVGRPREPGDPTAEPTIDPSAEPTTTPTAQPPPPTIVPRPTEDPTAGPPPAPTAQPTVEPPQPTAPPAGGGGATTPPSPRPRPTDG